MEWTAAMHYEESKEMLLEAGYLVIEKPSGHTPTYRESLMIGAAQTHAVLAQVRIQQDYLDELRKLVATEEAKLKAVTAPRKRS